MKSVLCAFSLFSRIPMPHCELRAENTRRLMAAFPLVGVVIGVAALGWLHAGGALGFGALLRGAGCALLPLLLTGGIHMDGFCDTADALAGHGDAAAKQRILRDPHAGAFAAMAAAGHLLAFAALAGEGFVSREIRFAFALSFVLSRCLSGFAVLLFPGSPESGMVRLFRGGAARRESLLLLCLWLAAVCAAMLWFGGAAGAVVCAASAGLFLWWRKIVIREFGGMSGDLAGCLLQLSELLSLAVLVVVPKILEQA